MSSDAWEPTPDQALAFTAEATYPDADLCLAGPRAWGKSEFLGADAIYSSAQHGTASLLVRRTYGALLDLEETLRRVAAKLCPGAQYRRSDKTLHLPGGGRVELSQMETRDHYFRFQGREYGFVAVDEATQFPDPALIDLLRASLRLPPDRFRISANFTGPGVNWFRRRYVTGRPLWLPYTEETSGRRFITCVGDYRRNPHVDAIAYEAQLAAAAGGRDTGLYRAWALGDPDAVEGGCYFDGIDLRAVELDASLWSPAWFREANGLAISAKFPNHTWRSTWGIDHGFSAPWVGLLCAQPPYHHPVVPDNRQLHRDSWVVLSEVALHDPNDLNKGLHLDIPDAVRHLVEESNRWGVEPEAILDSGCWQRHGSRIGTLAQEYERAGVRVYPSAKGSRAGGWARLRRLLAAGPDTPQLLISRRCRYLLETMHSAPRCPRNPDDIDPSSPDHALDALRYLLETETTGDDELEPVWL